MTYDFEKTLITKMREHLLRKNPRELISDPMMHGQPVATSPDRTLLVTLLKESKKGDFFYEMKQDMLRRAVQLNIRRTEYDFYKAQWIVPPGEYTAFQILRTEFSL